MSILHPFPFQPPKTKFSLGYCYYTRDTACGGMDKYPQDKILDRIKVREFLHGQVLFATR
jgi:hypothetical protein